MKSMYNTIVCNINIMILELKKHLKSDFYIVTYQLFSKTKA